MPRSGRVADISISSGLTLLDLHYIWAIVNSVGVAVKLLFYQTLPVGARLIMYCCRVFVCGEVCVCVLLFECIIISREQYIPRIYERILMRGGPWVAQEPVF